MTWTKDGEPIQRHWGAVRYSNWSIVLEELVTEDNGNYTCTVCNDRGCVEHTTKLDVIGESSRLMCANVWLFAGFACTPSGMAMALAAMARV